MAGQGVDDFFTSLVDQALSGPSAQPPQAPGGSAVAWGGRPIDRGFFLEAPVPDRMTEMNIVTAYKELHYIMNKTQLDAGWSLCSEANTLKKMIVANPAGVPRITLEEYAGLLALVREHVVTNADVYSYNGGKHAAADVDFELYMTLAILAARASSKALEERDLGTMEGYQRAAQHYAQAAEIMEAAYAELCNSGVATRERVGTPSELPWDRHIAPDGSTKAETVLMVNARARILRCESSVCHFLAIQAAIQDEPEAFAQELDEAAEYVARAFASVLRDMSRSGTRAGMSRIARYAELMTTLYRMHVIVHQAGLDVADAAADLDIVALGRALRRLDVHTAPIASADAWRVVTGAIERRMRSLVEAANGLRARCNELMTSNGSVFANVDRTGTMTEPMPVDPRDPAAFHQGDVMEGSAAAPFSIRALRDRYAAAHGQHQAFLELRIQYQALNRLVDKRMPDQVHPERERNMAEALILLFTQQLSAHNVPPMATATLAQGEVLSEVLTAAFQLGRLAERKAWADFAFVMADVEDASEPAKDVEDVDRGIIMAGQYFAELASDLCLPMPPRPSPPGGHQR